MSIDKLGHINIAWDLSEADVSPANRFVEGHLITLDESGTRYQGEAALREWFP